MKKLALIITTTVIMVITPTSADAKLKPWHDHKHDAPVTYVIDWD